MTLRRPKSHVLEYESELALRNQLPKEWILRKKDPDYGIDLEVEIVEKERVTNKVLWLQIKAKECIKPEAKSVSYQMKTKHLKYYESCSIPVIILFYIKSQNLFYYLFIQRFISETISVNNPDWRKKKTVSIKFPLDSRLENEEILESIAIEGRLYIAQRDLNIKSEGFQYWLDGIPQSDDEDLKERTLKALLYMQKEKYPKAIIEFKNILKFCITSHSERMSVLLNLGNAYYSLGQLNKALENSYALLKLAKKVNEGGVKEAESMALTNIGLIYQAKGELKEAMRCFKEALKISRDSGYRQGEANQLGNIGLILKNKGELDEALEYFNDTLKIDKEIGYKKGEASDFGNIGLIYRVKGESDKALKNHRKALKTYRYIGYKEGVANQLGNIGLIHKERGELDKALKYIDESLNLHKSIGFRLEEAMDYNNLSLIYKDKSDLDKAIKYSQDALNIHRTIGYKRGEALALGNMGLIYQDKGNLDRALRCLKNALDIFNKYSLTYQKEIFQNAIDSIEKKRIKRTKSR